MANLTILSLVFRPDNVSTAQLMADLAEDLMSRGHRVTILTTVPHYNHDEVASAEQPMRLVWGGILRRSNYRGMEVLHVWMPSKGRNKFYRVLTWLGFHVVSTIAGLFKIPKPDVILSPSPPLTIGISAWLISFFHRAGFIYNVQEIYPDVAINLGALRNRWLIDYLFRIERFVYDRAAFVTVISSRMRARLIVKGVAPEKVQVIPNFVDVAEFSPRPKDNGFSRKHGLVDKFVITYAGNMGKPQQLYLLLQAAALLRRLHQIHFLLMGSGSELESLRRQAVADNLTNVTFLSHQPYTVMPEAYGAADICYVPQAVGTSSDGIPSKVYRILAAARPVLALTDMESDLAALVDEADAGLVVATASGECIASAIELALQDKAVWARRGFNGRNHVARLYDRPVISERYHELIVQTAADIRKS